MSEREFVPTKEQCAVIGLDGSAFVRACPGAGKTRVMVERARILFRQVGTGRGVAFLSFTQAAVSELEARLRREGLLPIPVFPSFVGTFDSFVWQFLVAPFGITGSEVRPQLIADIGDLQVRPYDGARALALSCFDRRTGAILEEPAKRQGFDVTKHPEFRVRQYETTAKNIRRALWDQGYLSFDDTREVALRRIKQEPQAERIGAALAGRFREVIVDEAQDCNPEELMLIHWLRKSNLPVKIVCDPNQSIYAFRGGVTSHLIEFEESFPAEEKKDLSGNFRSAPNICKAITQFRPLSERGTPDSALGPLQDSDEPVHILAYQGSSAPPAIGKAFCALVQERKINLSVAPIVAATRETGAAAAGQARLKVRQDRVMRLAEAVADLHYPMGPNDVKEALNEAHRIVLELEGRLGAQSYHQYLSDNEMDPVSWRCKVVSILRELQYDPAKHLNAKGWHAEAKEVLSRHVVIKDGQSISQKLKWNAGLEDSLGIGPETTATPQTIHSVKGMEYPAVCVVTTRTLKGILDFLEKGEREDQAEEARKLYVAASRAERLLVIAAPKSQAVRLGSFLSKKGADVTMREV